MTQKEGEVRKRESGYAKEREREEIATQDQV